MKKIFTCMAILLFLLGCASFDTKQDTTSELERLAEGAEGKWSDYGDMGDGTVEGQDTFLIRDVDDTSLAATGTQKEYQWGDVVLDMHKIDCEDLADDTYQGRTVVYDCGDADNCAVGDIVFVDPADADPLKEADATTGSGEFPARGIVVVAGNDGSPTVIMTEGCYRDDSAYNWTVTAPTDFIYLGESDGTSTQTAPSTSGDCIQIIGYPINADTAYYDFGRPYSEVE